MNRVILGGRIGKEAPVLSEAGGVPMAKWTMACKDLISPKDSTKIYWARCVAWKKVAEIAAKWCKAGQEICVEGRLKRSEYMKSGVKVERDEVVVEIIHLLGSRPKEEKEEDPEIPF